LPASERTPTAQPSDPTKEGKCATFQILQQTASAEVIDYAYKGKPIDVRQIGKDLGVRYVLEGSVITGVSIFGARE